jgi:SulP family sulfate permease
LTGTAARPRSAQLQGNLFFGTTDQLFSELEQDLATRRYLLLDLRRVHSMDFTAAHLFEQMRERLVKRHGELLFSGMPSSLPTRQDIEDYMKQLGLESRKGGIRIFDTRDSALEWMEDRILEAAGWVTQEDEQPLALGEIEFFKELDAATITELAGAVREISNRAGRWAHMLSRGGQPADDISYFSCAAWRVNPALLPSKAASAIIFISLDLLARRRIFLVNWHFVP